LVKPEGWEAARSLAGIRAAAATLRAIGTQRRGSILDALDEALSWQERNTGINKGEDDG
jgi:hypothetical protein